jgi:hypothetical protein
MEPSSVPLKDGWYIIGENLPFLGGYSYQEVVCCIRSGQIVCIFGQSRGVRNDNSLIRPDYINGWRASINEPIEDILIRRYAPELLTPDIDEWETELEIEA